MKRRPAGAGKRTRPAVPASKLNEQNHLFWKHRRKAMLILSKRKSLLTEYAGFAESDAAATAAAASSSAAAAAGSGGGGATKAAAAPAVPAVDYSRYTDIKVTRSGLNAHKAAAMQAFADVRAQCAPQVWRNLQRMGYTQPTPVQQHAIPVAFAGHDVMCCAETGSGKTCAFLLPALSTVLQAQAEDSRLRKQQQQQQAAGCHDGAAATTNGNCKKKNKRKKKRLAKQQQQQQLRQQQQLQGVQAAAAAAAESAPAAAVQGFDDDSDIFGPAGGGDGGSGGDGGGSGGGDGDDALLGLPSASLSMPTAAAMASLQQRVDAYTCTASSTTKKKRSKNHGRAAMESAAKQEAPKPAATEGSGGQGAGEGAEEKATGAVVDDDDPSRQQQKQLPLAVYHARAKKPPAPRVLVLAPTRELAQQIAVEARKLCHRTPLRTLCLYGGGNLAGQLKNLAFGCDVLVATPGRLADFLSRGIISLHQVRSMVLDEADRMLDLGFEGQIRHIIASSDLPPKARRRNAMFSATFPNRVQQLASAFLREYVWIAVGKVGAAASSIRQRLFCTPADMPLPAKFKRLFKALRKVAGRTLVFTRTKAEAIQVHSVLALPPAEGGFGDASAQIIHADRNQAQRQRALAKFAASSGTAARILVATDVAARGLDVPAVEHVVNFSLPKNFTTYVHRIGRTGRAGAAGLATSFYTPGFAPHAGNGKMAPMLLQSMRDAGQPVPGWFTELREVTHSDSAEGDYHSDLETAAAAAAAGGPGESGQGGDSDDEDGGAHDVRDAEWQRRRRERNNAREAAASAAAAATAAAAAAAAGGGGASGEAADLAWLGRKHVSVTKLLANIVAGKANPDRPDDAEDDEADDEVGEAGADGDDAEGRGVVGDESSDGDDSTGGGVDGDEPDRPRGLGGLGALARGKRKLQGAQGVSGGSGGGEDDGDDAHQQKKPKQGGKKSKKKSKKKHRGTDHAAGGDGGGGGGDYTSADIARLRSVMRSLQVPEEDVVGPAADSSGDAGGRRGRRDQAAVAAAKSTKGKRRGAGSGSGGDSRGTTGGAGDRSVSSPSTAAPTPAAGARKASGKREKGAHKGSGSGGGGAPRSSTLQQQFERLRRKFETIDRQHSN